MADINSEVFTNLRKKVNYYNSTLSKDLAKKLVNEGRDRLAQEYSFNLAIQGVKVGRKMTTSTSGQVYATGEDVAFEEFGTGRVGQKSAYPNELLPKQVIEFESPKGHQQITRGWVYYYPNKYTKVKYKGKYGWRYNGNFTRGMPAGKQMYNTAKYLRNNLVDIAKQTIKEKLNG